MYTCLIGFSSKIGRVYTVLVWWYSERRTAARPARWLKKEAIKKGRTRINERKKKDRKKERRRKSPKLLRSRATGRRKERH